MQSAYSLLLSTAIVLIATAFGRRLLSLTRVPLGGLAESLSLGLGLGFGILGYAVLAIGLAGVLYTWVLVSIPAFMLLISLGEIRRLVSEVCGWFLRNAPVKLSAGQALILSAVLCLGAAALIRALTPPSSMDWDGLAYHLAVPKMYLREHRVFYIPFISHSNFPFLTEMLYTLGLALNGAVLAKLFHYWIYLALGIAVYGLGRRHFSPRVGSIASLVLLSVPVVFWEAGVAYVDLSTALYVTLTLFAVMKWETERRTAWLVISGLMGGFALGTKIIAIIPIATLALWIFLANRTGIHWSRRLTLAGLMGLVAMVICAPWYIKSYVYTGNPVYPFLYSVFGGRYWSETAALAYRESQLAFGHGRSLTDFLLVPWTLTMDGYRFYDLRSLTGLVGPAFLGLVPVYVLASKGNRWSVFLGIVSFAYLLAWFVLMQQSRYLIPIMPILAIISAMGVTTANELWQIGRHCVNVFLAFCVALTVVLGALMSTGPAKVLIGSVGTEDYLSQTVIPYDAQMYANTHLSPKAKIVLFDEVLGFYLDRSYIWGNPGHHELIPWESFETGRDMVRFFVQSGYSHALINWLQWTKAGDDVMHTKLIPDAIGRGLMVEIFASRGASLYEFVEIQ